ncbi:MAG: tRNA (guanosine(37)-N1)-methyltransferase TrmD [Flavobacteriaceae bacterium]|nr:tRNA (guanosine(37)-N1)-methyltransferase TrmD [Flavobacteriaceae bacterium]|tara:strand:- start:11085 stop:11762 length:678 start_codon:yes stop_codon:yes gene_type:complete
MRIDIITIFPDLIKSPFNNSIIKRAKESNLVKIYFHNPRDYTNNKYKQVDDYPYGGGAGMVMMIEPISKCIEKLISKRQYDEIIYLSPDGNKLKQSTCNKLSTKKNLILLCGHYKGVDQRIRDHYITLEVSIGDFVLSGGELAAAVLCDSIIRIIPGVLGDQSSALSDSFQDGLLAPPIYTRPSDYNGLKVPDVLLSGNTSKIDQWREEKSLEITRNTRPDLLKD